MKRIDFDFEVPDELVAAEPSARRDASRLMVLRRSGAGVEHKAFSDLPGLLNPGDCLVLNRSRVLPARLPGRKATGGAVDLLLLTEESPGVWRSLAVGVKPGLTVDVGDGVSATVEERVGESWRVRFSTPEVRAHLERRGLPPLPPYIRGKRKRAGLPDARPEDMERYQTVYAQERGSLAAPTAGLHYTPEVLADLKARGIAVAELILHVGLGTFKPVVAEDVSEHVMLPESYEVPSAAVDAIRKAKAGGGRVIAVGTTATRTLETVFANGVLAEPTAPLTGETALYILPGRPFAALDALQTNFHQPASTPLLLTCAFAGKERVFAAYREAIEKRYRLFSYGDAMLIL